MPVDSGKDYSFVSLDTKLNHKDVIRSIDFQRQQNEELIKKYSCEKPPEAYTFFVKKARQFMKERFYKIGLPISNSQIIDPLFVKEEHKKYLFKHIGEIEDKIAGNYMVINKKPIIFFDKDIAISNNYNQAVSIYHEMFHSTGNRLVVFQKDGIKERRVGLSIQGEGSSLTPWLFEEGLAVYESAGFCEKIMPTLPKQFRKEFDIREDIIHKQSNYYGKLMFYDPTKGLKFTVDSRYTRLSIDPGNSENTRLSIYPAYALAGEFIGMIINNIPKNERENFVKTIFIARNDPKQISKLASTIDNYFGKGMYAKILKCEQTEEAVLGLIKQINSQKSNQQ
jgi:hypothetical protein